MIDSHTHLHLCEPPDTELVAAAEAAGVTRMLTVGTDGASSRTALAAAEDVPAGVRGGRPAPERGAGFDDADLAELPRSPRTSAAWRSARRARLLP